jgi:NADPH2:quinone reductase
VRAAVCRAYGAPETVTVEDVPSVPPGPGEVRIGVTAAAVNFPDVLLVAGEYQIKVPPPFTPGSELAGTVLEVGSGVSGIAVGDRVFGTTMSGAFAEEVVVAATAVQPTPAAVGDAAAAAFGVAHRTAFHTLRSVARVQAGDEVVVLGAGGGVGLATVALATLLGAKVTAVAGSDDRLAAAAAEGAVLLIDRRAGDLRAQLRDLLPNGTDVVVDTVGGDLAEPALRSLRWGGRFVTVGYASGTIPRIPLNLVLLKGVQILGFEFRGFVGHEPEAAARDDAELLQLLAAGRVTPHIGATYGLDAVVDALRLVGDGHAVGKVVLDLSLRP